jgi:hypothetical protein
MSWAHHRLYPLSLSLHFPLTVVVSSSSVRSAHKCGRVDVASAHGLSAIWLQRTPEPAATLSHRTLSSSFLSPCRLWEPRGKDARKIRRIFRTWLQICRQLSHNRYKHDFLGAAAEHLRLWIFALTVPTYLQTFCTFKAEEKKTLVRSYHWEYTTSSSSLPILRRLKKTLFLNKTVFFLNKKEK